MVSGKVSSGERTGNRDADSLLLFCLFSRQVAQGQFSRNSWAEYSRCSPLLHWIRSRFPSSNSSCVGCIQFVRCEDSEITKSHRSIQGFLRCQNVSRLGRFKKSSVCWRFQDMPGLQPSCRVPVELIINGQAVARQEIEADGEVHELEFNYTPDISSWVALRIFPSSHTNPIFVEVDHQPIRSSRRSAEWCLQTVDVCWEMKQGKIRDHERETAAAAFEVARQACRRIRDESFDDREK